MATTTKRAWVKEEFPVKPKRSRRNSPVFKWKLGDAEKLRASTAPAPTAAKTTSGDGCDGVWLEKESSAWDSLGERYELAARDGRVLDLTGDEDGGTEVSAKKAMADFGKLPEPSNPAELVHSDAESKAIQLKAPNPKLAHVSKGVDGVVALLGAARLVLVDSIFQSGDVVDKDPLTAIISATLELQKLVNVDKLAVSQDQRLMEKLLKLNSLVNKANLLIRRYNDDRGLATPAPMSSG